ncbi:hypothetical protein MCUN1_000010 [Malassezia cuniculi]|uniref:Phosphate transporter n=1 Tax=Malassezia cuniculi TaxID=948313 RepID=A0AAF0EQK0_9BASI|nr:hypothetical protein MCUN1_000010 [Malassezia cuniculi]
MAVLRKYDWIFALITIFFCVSSFSNGANDVANSYATSVAARTIPMWVAGILAACTEFIGAVAMGSRVTQTIKSGIIDIARFKGNPGTFMLAMACAEAGSATWLAIATSLSFPVSTTQCVIGALIGVGFASQANVHWEWKKGSVSQVAASWGISPAIAAGFSAIVFLTIKFGILKRADPLKWGLRLIPVYLATTAAILAVFIIDEAPSASLEKLGAKAVGIALGVWAGVFLISLVFFMPYFHRRLVVRDRRIRMYHVILGPLLLKEDPPLFLPGREDEITRLDGDLPAEEKAEIGINGPAELPASTSDLKANPLNDIEAGAPAAELNAINPSTVTPDALNDTNAVKAGIKRRPTPEERFLAPTAHLPPFHPRRIWSFILYGFLHGVTVEVVNFHGDKLKDIHAKAEHYDPRVEDLWTFCQVVSAMLMSIAHGANDVSNAVGPWSATYETWQSSMVVEKSSVPTWMLVVAGLLLGLGFWFYGYNIVRQLGNNITHMSPTRGFSIEIGAAVTVLLASELSLPVSTTQCLTGAAVVVALMNFSPGALNIRAVLWIFSGWILTLPIAGLIAGLMMLMALNTPHF